MLFPFWKHIRHIHGSRQLVDLDVLVNVKLMIDNEKMISCPLCKNFRECRIQTEACWVKVWLRFICTIPIHGTIDIFTYMNGGFFCGKLVGKDTIVPWMLWVPFEIYNVSDKSDKCVHLDGSLEMNVTSQVIVSSPSSLNHLGYDPW